MRTKLVTILGKEYLMALTTEAMFRIMEELHMEQPTEIGEKIIRDYSRDGLKDICTIAGIMAEEAEAGAAYTQRSKAKRCDFEPEIVAALLRRASLGELVAVKNSLIEVVNEGFKREVTDEEVDEGLIELAKKEEAR